MKLAIVAMVATFLLAGCTPEVKESKQESKQAIQQTESIQKSVTAFTEQDENYMKVVNKSLQTFIDNVTGISNLMKQANSNPSIAKDEEWMNELQGRFVGIAMTNELLKGMENDGVVPERFENLHSNLEQSFELMVEAGQGLIQSVKNDMNMELFNASMQTMAESTLKMNEVTAELKEINAK